MHFSGTSDLGAFNNLQWRLPASQQPTGSSEEQECVGAETFLCGFSTSWCCGREGWGQLLQDVNRQQLFGHVLSGFQRVKQAQSNSPTSVCRITASTLWIWMGEWEGKTLSLNFLIFYFEDKGKPLREVQTISHCSMPLGMWRHWCNAVYISPISDQQI